jgi:ABC-2 type transport system permease protein
MFKLYASLRKEFLLLINDWVGLILMFLMPLLLVFIITIIQDSAYKMVNENKIELLIVNHDQGREGEKLLALLKKSGVFDLKHADNIPQEEVKKALSQVGAMMGLYIPVNFTASLNDKASNVSAILMDDLGLEHETVAVDSVDTAKLILYSDPVLQENYSYSMMGIIYSYMSMIENTRMIEQMYESMDIGGKSERLQAQMISNRMAIEHVVALNNAHAKLPNSTQHNVPAWTIFAMFFMVVSLGSNIVKERINGSFLRLKTMPTSFMLVMTSKMVIYVLVAALQIVVIFSMGIWILPLLGLPLLVMPDNLLALVIVVLLSSMSAVSYALLIGSVASTEEQANGFGAISIILFGAIGGILVPTFVMPSGMQFATNFSPLHWCLEGFYILFLKGGSWEDLKLVIVFLTSFIVFCQVCTYAKLRLDKII